MRMWPLAVAVALVGIVAVWLARRALLVVRIDGRSMEPTFHPGAAVLAVRRRSRQTLHRDDIVVCRLPPQIPGPDALLIKRITGVAGDTAALGWCRQDRSSCVAMDPAVMTRGNSGRSQSGQ